MEYKVYEEKEEKEEEITLRLLKGIECNRSGEPDDIYVCAVGSNGLPITSGLLLRFNLSVPSKTITRMAGVGKGMGFKLDNLGCILLSDELEEFEE